MKFVRGLYNLRERKTACVATIGNFDGVHLGHQEMVRMLVAEAARLGLPSTIVSFEPSPQEFFAGDKAPARLMRTREKCAAFSQLGVDRFVCLRFDARMAGISPEMFVQSILVERLQVRQLVVGHDFRFAHHRAGSVATLRELGKQHDFGVVEVAPFLFEDERVSSSLVRAALQSGNLYRARRLLGRPYRLSGKVVPGERLGRKLGFPTANLCLHRRVVPLQGVFAVRVTGAGLTAAPGVANLGTRPALQAIGGQTARPLLEVHVFDFTGDLYRRELHVDFIARLRDERWFADLDAMIVQMHEDAREARALLEADGGRRTMDS